MSVTQKETSKSIRMEGIQKISFLIIPPQLILNYEAEVYAP